MQYFCKRSTGQELKPANNTNDRERAKLYEENETGRKQNQRSELPAGLLCPLILLKQL